jgi:hypothetical protein
MDVETSPVSLAVVPSASGRLHFCWGLGNELFVCDVSGGPVAASTSTCIQW